MRLALGASYVCVSVLVDASSIHLKYDGSTLSYDPQGRLYQVEYAMEATKRGRTVVGVCGASCAVLVTRDPSPSSPCLSAPENTIWAVDSHICIAATGLRSDIHHVVDCARTWCSEHRYVFGVPIPCRVLARRLADMMHSYTTRGGRRPLAIDALIAGVDATGASSIHQVQGTGAFQRYRAFAVGGEGPAAIARLAKIPEHCVSRKQGSNDGLQEAAQLNRGRGSIFKGNRSTVAEYNRQSNLDESERMAGLPQTSEISSKPRDEDRHQELLEHALVALWEDDDSADILTTGEQFPVGKTTNDSEVTAGRLKAASLSATIIDFYPRSCRSDGVDCRSTADKLDGEGRFGAYTTSCSANEIAAAVEKMTQDQMLRSERKPGAFPKPSFN